MELLSVDKTVSAPRLLAFDLARGVAILSMVVQHVVFMYGSRSTRGSLLGSVLLGLGGLPAAPVFLFLMGVFFKYTRRTGDEVFRSGVVKGIRLFFLGYFLNIIRFTVPIALGAEMQTFTLSNAELLSLNSSLFVVDILQCAGLSLIFMSFINRYFKQDHIPILAAASVLLISPLIWGVETGIFVLDLFLTALWGTGSAVLFPVFPYLAYSLVGMFFGNLLVSEKPFSELIRFFRNVGFLLLPVAMVIALRNTARGFPVIGMLITAVDPVFRMASYEHPTPVVGVLTVGFLFVWGWLCHVLVEKVPSNRLYDLLFFWSKNVTAFYVIHWAVVGWGILVLGYQKADLAMVAGLILLTLVISHLMTLLYRNLKERAVGMHPALRDFLGLV